MTQATAELEEFHSQIDPLILRARHPGAPGVTGGPARPAEFETHERHLLAIKSGIEARIREWRVPNETYAIRANHLQAMQALLNNYLNRVHVFAKGLIAANSSIDTTRIDSWRVEVPNDLILHLIDQDETFYTNPSLEVTTTGPDTSRVGHSPEAILALRIVALTESSPTGAPASALLSHIRLNTLVEYSGIWAKTFLIWNEDATPMPIPREWNLPQGDRSLLQAYTRRLIERDESSEMAFALAETWVDHRSAILAIPTTTPAFVRELSRGATVLNESPDASADTAPEAQVAEFFRQHLSAPLTPESISWSPLPLAHPLMTHQVSATPNFRPENFVAIMVGSQIFDQVIRPLAEARMIGLLSYDDDDGMRIVSAIEERKTAYYRELARSPAIRRWIDAARAQVLAHRVRLKSERIETLIYQAKLMPSLTARSALLAEVEPVHASRVILEISEHNSPAIRNLLGQFALQGSSREEFRQALSFYLRDEGADAAVIGGRSEDTPSDSEIEPLRFDLTQLQRYIDSHDFRPPMSGFEGMSYNRAQRIRSQIALARRRKMEAVMEIITRLRLRDASTRLPSVRELFTDEDHQQAYLHSVREVRMVANPLLNYELPPHSPGVGEDPTTVAAVLARLSPWMASYQHSVRSAEPVIEVALRGIRATIQERLSLLASTRDTAALLTDARFISDVQESLATSPSFRSGVASEENRRADQNDLLGFGERRIVPTISISTGTLIAMQLATFGVSRWSQRFGPVARLAQKELMGPLSRIIVELCFATAPLFVLTQFESDQRAQGRASSGQQHYTINFLAESENQILPSELAAWKQQAKISRALFIATLVGEGINLTQSRLVWPLLSRVIRTVGMPFFVRIARALPQSATRVEETAVRLDIEAFETLGLPVGTWNAGQIDAAVEAALRYRPPASRVIERTVDASTGSQLIRVDFPQLSERTILRIEASRARLLTRMERGEAWHLRNTVSRLNTWGSE